MSIYPAVQLADMLSATGSHVDARFALRLTEFAATQNGDIAALKKAMGITLRNGSKTEMISRGILLLQPGVEPI